MAEFSNYLENKLLDHVLKNTAYSSPTTTFVGLLLSDPGDGNTGTEVTGSGYARQSLSVNSASSGSTSNSADVIFPQAGSAWGTVTHIGIFDALTSGNLLMYSPATESKTVGNGDIIKIVSGALTVSLD